MHRHPQYNWLVLSAAGNGSYAARCEVCGAGAHLSTQDLQRFVELHANHRSASPSHLGAGDAVAAIAKPIASALGRKPCTPCEQRRQALNSWVPSVPLLRRR